MAIEKKIHFSIDDVGAIFREIEEKGISCESDSAFLKNLKKWHELYNIRCSLYLFEPVVVFEMVKKYSWIRDYFTSNKEWICIGLHGNKVAFKKDYEYKSEFYIVELISEILGVPLADSVRLHNWFATSEQKKFLAGKGVKTIFYPDDDCFRYDSEDSFLSDGLIHKRTNVRIESLQQITKEVLQIDKKKNLVVFTHENCVETYEQEINQTLKMYVENGYTFY